MFNVVNVDLQSPRISRHSCTWDVQNKIYAVATPFDQPFAKNAKRERFSLQREWAIELESSSLKFCHPRKTPIELGSYYVWPHLSVISHKKATDLRICGQKAAIDWLSEHKRLRVVGSIKAGKTSLLKMLYKQLLAEGFLPLFIDLAEADGNIEAQISRAATSQYRNLKWSDVAGDCRVVILADNFDRCRVKLTKRLEILEAIANGAAFAVICTNYRDDLE